jgi:hypothetical protein
MANNKFRIWFVFCNVFTFMSENDLTCFTRDEKYLGQIFIDVAIYAELLAGGTRLFCTDL